MKKQKLMLSSIAALTIIGTHAFAESNELNSIDVWDTQVISSSLNLGQAAIETKQADHLSDLLRDIPGVDVGGTHSINNRINIRGLQDEDLDITVDGAKIQNANMFHHIGNLLINPDILKKADIQVGTNSVVNGSLGGSVAFETKDGRDLLEDGQNFGARFSTNYNSNDSLGGSISTYGKISEKTDFLLYHNYVNKDNWEDGRGVRTFGVEGEIQNTLLKFGHILNDNNKISILYDRLQDKGDYSPRPDFGADYNRARTGNYTYPTDYTRDTITLKHELDLGESFRVDTSVYYNQNVLERYEYLGGTPVRPGMGIADNTKGNLKGKVKTIGVNTQAQSNIDQGELLHTLTYGALYDIQSSKVTWDGAKYGDNEEAKSFAMYIEDAIDFNNGLVVTPGIRYNYYDLDGAYGQITDNEVTYGLATQYAVTEDLTLLASATTLYKGVEMVDVLASNRAVVADNTNLKSETGINKEVGFRYIKNDVLGADDIGFSFKYFQTTINDYINQTWTDMSNMGDLEIQGYELSFAYNKGDFNSLFTFAHSTSLFESTGEPLIKEPGDTLSAKLDYKIMPNLDISWESLFAFKEDKIQSGGIHQVKKSYNVHDMAINWKPKAYKGLTVIAGIDNIFDKEYYSHISENRYYSGYGLTTDYEPGRNFKVTLSYKF